MLASEHIKVRIRMRIVKCVVKQSDRDFEDSLGFVDAVVLGLRSPRQIYGA